MKRKKRFTKVSAVFMAFVLGLLIFMQGTLTSAAAEETSISEDVVGSEDGGLNLIDNASNEDTSADNTDDTDYVPSEIDGQMVPDAPTQLETETDIDGESDEEESIVPEEAADGIDSSVMVTSMADSETVVPMVFFVKHFSLKKAFKFPFFI